MILTIISSYYDKSPREIEFLKRRIKHFHLLREKYPDVKMVIVDDGSQDVPITEAVKDFDLTNISLARIKEDLGFNSHGARNLGMHLSTTDWNFFIDLDWDLSSIINEFDKLVVYDKRVILLVAMNIFAIHKDTFWSCKGYDEDFVNNHFGDRLFLSYFEENFEVRQTPLRIKCFRMGRTIERSESVTKTDYSKKGKVLIPKDSYDRADEILKVVNERYKTLNFTEKKILNFKWESLT